MTAVKFFGGIFLLLLKALAGKFQSSAVFRDDAYHLVGNPGRDFGGYFQGDCYLRANQAGVRHVVDAAEIAGLPQILAQTVV